MRSTSPQSGVEAALTAVLKDANVAPEAVAAVMVGTTHFINAFLQRRDMQRVALIRLAAPATFGTPPLLSWTQELREGPSICRGG